MKGICNEKTEVSNLVPSLHINTRRLPHSTLNQRSARVLTLDNNIAWGNVHVNAAHQFSLIIFIAQ